MVRVRSQQGAATTAVANIDEELHSAVKFHERIVVVGAVAAGITVVQIAYKLFQDPQTFSASLRYGHEKAIFSPLEALPMAIAFTCGVISLYAYDHLLRKQAQKKYVSG